DQAAPQVEAFGTDFGVLHQGRLTIVETPGVDDSVYLPATMAHVVQSGLHRGVGGNLDRLADLLARCGFGSRPAAISLEQVRAGAATEEREAIADLLDDFVRDARRDPDVSERELVMLSGLVTKIRNRGKETAAVSGESDRTEAQA
ncbi:MAG: hypothetical protein KGR26_12275, partial [Cyanobacteria bacterium REEB65]|nr:hypothetical protein [Cyanobacteria bacterium REEB65]